MMDDAKAKMMTATICDMMNAAGLGLFEKLSALSQCTSIVVKSADIRYRVEEKSADEQLDAVMSMLGDASGKLGDDDAEPEEGERHD